MLIKKKKVENTPRQTENRGQNLRMGDIVYVNYGHDAPAGLYEVLSNNKYIWIKNDGDGSYNGKLNNLGKLRLVCPVENRYDL